MNAVLTGIVTLRILPQHLEQFVITAFVPTPNGDQIFQETEIAPRDSEPSAHYEHPVANGNRPGSLSQYGQ